MQFRSFVGSTVFNDAAVLYAVLAICARHREITTGVGEQKSNEYERKCLQVLIPSLYNITEVLQETTLASALLLRLLGEMTGTINPISRLLTPVY